MASKFKTILVHLGSFASDQSLARLRSALGYLEIGALTKRQLGRTKYPLVTDRFAVFAAALEALSGRQILYLEFGVFEGETIRWWAEHVTSPDARFVGFDSFEGLPEHWRPGFDEGQFGTGEPPDIADERVSFVQGWFEETLPNFELPSHDQLVVNVDSDLYSSAVTVLSHVAPFLRSGSLLYFDELADRDHELRALKEFLAREVIDLEPITAGGGGAHFLFRVR